MKLICLIILFLSLFQTVGALSVERSADTAAGRVELGKNEENNSCEILLGSCVIKKFDCEYGYAPVIIGHLKGNFSAYSDVLVIQRLPMGNACNGGALEFLGLSEGGSHSFSEAISFCGGLDPIVAQSQEKAILIFPGGPPNRGGGYIPTEVWIFENGEIEQLK